jgi:plasmid stabilization system protein ParE
MNTSFRLTPDAEADVIDARDWYEQFQTGRGDEFIVELRDRLQAVCKSSATHGKVTKNIRAARMKKSKFNIFYRIESSEIIVVAVLHERADARSRLRRR